MKVGSKAFFVVAPIASAMIGCIATVAQAGVIDIANNSFESPTVAPNPALLTAPPWILDGSGTVYEPFGPGTGTVAAGVGIFTNPGTGSVGHLNGVDGNQLSYLFNSAGNSITQGLVNPGNTNQATTFQAGQSYTLTVAAANATAAPGPTSKLFVDLFYVDGTGRHNVAEKILDPSLLSGTQIIDFSTTPTGPLLAGDPAIAKQINVGFFATGPGGGEFDVDNVRLVAVPEPASFSLLGAGVASLLLRRRRSHQG